MIGKNTKFESIIDVMDYFDTQETCKKFLAEMRWGKNVICPHCKHDNVYHTKAGYRCSNKECRMKFSVITKTIFEGTKIPLRKWFIAMFMLINNNPGISSVSLAKLLKISQPAAWFLLHRLREVMRNAPISKLSDCVQVDETMFGGKESKKPKSKRSSKNRGVALIGTKKLYIIGALQQNGNVITSVTNSRTSDVLIPFINQNVEKNSIVVSDAHKGYNPLTENGFVHVKNKHGEHKFVVTIEGKKYHTQTMEGYWSLFKGFTFGTHRYVSFKHLISYAGEHSYRYNLRKEQPSSKFNSLFSTVENSRMKYYDLVARKSLITK